jgi:uncharacterized SAM-binding protein YcdF (DUF218 family)
MMLALRLVLGVVGAVLTVWLLVLAAVYLYGQRDGARPADVIVVLGAAQYDGRPSPVLRARVDHAVGLYQADVAPRLIMTGGVGVGDTVSEARVGLRYAVRSGVPEEHILLEEAGIRSIESLQAVALLMEEEGMETAVLVSDPFHMLRLRILSRRLGIRMSSSPTRTSPISADREEEWRFILRESLIIPTLLLPF